MSMDGPFSDPGIPDGERTEFRGLIGGRPAGEGFLSVAERDGGYVQRVEAWLAEGYELELELSWARHNGTLLAESYALDTRDGERTVPVRRAPSATCARWAGAAPWRAIRAT